MELSLIKLQDASPGRPFGERRGRIRHKLNSPVYARFNGTSDGMVMELNELLDLSEDGFAVQTSSRLEINRPITLSLDLPEIKANIYSAGQVVWRDAAGRAGIRFSGLTEQSRKVLKEWMLVNLLVASTRSQAHKRPSAPSAEARPLATEPVLPPVVAAPVPDLSGMLSAVEAVRREVRAKADDFDAALHLITERALSLTGASGAALAFLTDDKMICRASVGEPALPLGTAVDVKQGITGECVRAGRMVACEDVETDSRVDREICQVLGIGSILATPIVADFKVVGLLEVFSPLPHAFTHVHETALDRLVELVPKAASPALPAPNPVGPVAAQALVESTPTTGTVREVVWEQEREAQEPLKGVPVRLTHIILLSLTVAVLALASGYLLAPKIEKFWASRQASESPGVTASKRASAATRKITPAMTFSELQKLAEQGDEDAQWEIGSRYRNGDGVPQNDAQAAKWFEQAAEQGHASSQRALGGLYWSGHGVSHDLSKAYFWSVLAANQGDEISISQVQGLAIQMTPAQVAEAQSQADNWLNQHRVASKK
jgi:putative methionine-R-sulfoxide reductase with GAF domain